MIDLKTRYLGIQLEHPIVASASPLAREFDGIRRLEDAGAAAIVTPSVYEEEIEAEDAAFTSLMERGSLTQPETASYFPDVARPVGSLEGRLETLRRASEACAVPIIASLNGSTPAGWIERFPAWGAEASGQYFQAFQIHPGNMKRAFPQVAL